jgi:ABC-type Zn uptake system ZnuABC Zn-binding protein ZnuA
MLIAGQSGVQAILQTPFELKRFSEMISARTGVPVVTLAPSVGSVARATDYLSMMDYNVAVLARTLASATR